jgi:hypothetical protein
MSVEVQSRDHARRNRLIAIAAGAIIVIAIVLGTTKSSLRCAANLPLLRKVRLLNPRIPFQKKRKTRMNRLEFCPICQLNIADPYYARPVQ